MSFPNRTEERFSPEQVGGPDLAVRLDLFGNSISRTAMIRRSHSPRHCGPEAIR
jgi:hypothetical protein